MSEDQKKQLETQLWGIANLLRGKISADDYRDLHPGFYLLQIPVRKTILLCQRAFGRRKSN